MTAIEHARAMVAEVEAMLGRHKETLATIETEAAAEAAKVPTMEDVRALVARVPVA